VTVSDERGNINGYWKVLPKAVDTSWSDPIAGYALCCIFRSDRVRGKPPARR
jgi:hypothetical protein